MLRKVIASTLLLSTSQFAYSVDDCAAKDEDLIFCPVVQAPLRTELREGWVLLEYLVEPDGSVTNAIVIDSDVRGLWNDAAIKTINQWRYREADEPVKKTRRFTMKF
ncbi:MAG: TonB family protein [Pseudomonadales bacterium]|nr:TonB family protein [Pseudomonadales bacterium]